MQNVIQNDTASGAKWVYRAKNEQLYWQLINDYGQSDFVASIAATRGWINEDNFAGFIDPKIKDSMPDPFLLKDMLEATQFVKQVLQAKQKIAVFADYDVDGGTSAAIIYRFFKMLGVEIQIYVPDRIKEGYGPNSNALLNLRKSGIDLVITVDCGTTAFEPLEKAADAGLKVIVIDHHLGVKDKPSSIAVINPNRYDETSELTYLCGAGVCFMFCVAMLKTLEKPELKSNLMSLLDLVALGTVCDVVPLQGLNRAFVKTGLKVANNKKNAGLVALCEVAGLHKTLDSGDFGFNIGPMINAGGRIGKSDMGALTLASDDTGFAKKMATELRELNLKRREMESIITEKAIASVAANINENDAVIFAFDKDWHEGIIGIVASRIKDKFYKPTFIGSITEDGNIKASCRSIFGVNIGEVIVEAVHKELLIKGGGHGMAAGFSLDFAKKDLFLVFVNEKLQKKVNEAKQQRVVEADYCLSLGGATVDLCDKIEQLEPFGMGNPEPTFVIKDVIITGSKIVKDAHVSVFLKCQNSGVSSNAIAFKCADSLMGSILLNNKGKTLDLLCKIGSQMYLGQKKVSIIIQDINI